MYKHAIVFNHNPFIDSEVNDITTSMVHSAPIKEYFVPYSQDALLEIIDDKTLRQRIESSKNQEKTFDQFVEKYNLQNESYIERIDDIQFGEDSPYWINETENITEPSLWDYLADTRAVVEAERYRFENLIYVNSLANVTMNSRRDLYNIKLIISVLVYIDGEDNYFDTNEPFPNDNNNFNSIDYDNIRHFYEDVRNFIASNFNFDFNIDRYLENTNNRRISNTDIVVTEICSLIQELKTNNLGKLKKDEYKNIIKKLMIELFDRLDPFFSERLKEISAFHTLLYGKHTKLTHSIDQMNICINNKLYASEKEVYINHIKKSINTFINNAEQIGDMKPNHYPSLQNVDSFFSDNYDANVHPPRWAKESYGTGYGCFALLITNSNKKYFSFSNAYEVNPNNHVKMENLAKMVMENVLNRCLVKNVYDHTYSYNWGYLHSDAMRYTQIIENGAEDPTKYILKTETYINDNNADLLDTFKKIGDTYGCCERKMLGFSGFNDAIEIFSRWAPCWRCRPAVLDAQPCDFYAFADLDDIKSGKNVIMDLKKYTVKRTTTYSVS